MHIETNFYKLITNLPFVNQQAKDVNHDHLDNHLNIFLINILSRFCLQFKIKITNYWYQNIEIISVQRLLFPTNIYGYPKKICSTVLSVAYVKVFEKNEIVAQYVWTLVVDPWRRERHKVWALAWGLCFISTLYWTSLLSYIVLSITSWHRLIIAYEDVIKNK